MFFQGDGTREGTGECKCNSGYRGRECEECKEGYFEEAKNKTDITCTSEQISLLYIESCLFCSIFTLGNG